MTKIIVETNIDFSPAELNGIQEIFLALIKSGGLTGVKNGQTIIHFDKDGLFQGVQLSYWPWTRRNPQRFTL